MSQCEATTNPCYWWDSERIEFPRCSKGATVEIDGVKMCLQHAGTMAVLKLIGMGKAKKIKDSPALCATQADNMCKRIRRL